MRHDRECTQAGRACYLRCDACRAKFSVAMGMPLGGTHLPMRVWFTALYLVAASSKGVSSVKLAEHLGIGQKIARFLGQRIRRMMEDKDGLLAGIVAADETCLGGRTQPKGQASKRYPDDDQPAGRSGSRKSMVTVATERGGKARAAKGRTHLGRSFASLVSGNVSRDGTLPLSDELPACRCIDRKRGAHQRVDHSKSGHVRADDNAAAVAHTNTAASLDPMLRRARVGVFHWFSVKCVDCDPGEVTFRWSARKVPAGQRLQSVSRRSTGGRCWKEPVA